MKPWKGTQISATTASLNFETFHKLWSKNVTGRWIEVFHFAYSKRYKKSYLWYESKSEKVKIAEYV